MWERGQVLNNKDSTYKLGKIGNKILLVILIWFYLRFRVLIIFCDFKHTYIEADIMDSDFFGFEGGETTVQQ